MKWYILQRDGLEIQYLIGPFMDRERAETYKRQAVLPESIDLEIIADWQMRALSDFHYLKVPH